MPLKKKESGGLPMKLHRADQALEMFEEALGLIEAIDTNPEPRTGLPAAPLPSLLDQCEDLLLDDTNTTPVVRVLYSFPGLKPGGPSWWKGRRPGLTCLSASTGWPMLPSDQGVSETIGARVILESVETLRRELARAGRHLLLTAGMWDSALPTQMPSMSTVLICHPLRAFANSRTGLSLSQFCTQLHEWLLAHKGLSMVRLEEQSASDTDLMTALGKALDLPQARISSDIYRSGVLSDTPHSSAILKGTDFLDCEAYLALCDYLHYAPEEVPELPSDGLDSLALDTTEVVHRYNLGGDATGLISDFITRARSIFRHFGPPNSNGFNDGALVNALDGCLKGGEDGFLEALDRLVDELPDETAALTLLAAAAHFHKLGQRLHALSFVSEAFLRAPVAARWLQVLGASLLLDMNALDQTTQVLLRDVLQSDGLPQAQRSLLETHLAKLGVGQNAGEHGHALLMDYLAQTPPALTGRRKPVMIEVGTTRETVPGQGSTEKLAMLCAELGIDFITVDMDPRNGRFARRMFQRLGLPFQAVTAKGEDFLAAYPGQIDYVFLDAYDFDHGNHSEMRQSRYEQFLGGRIEEEQCHQMHLDCAVSLIEKLAPDGVICFDDTWQDETGAWTAKGTTAMPYLLENGFELISTQNNAALLKRGD